MLRNAELSRVADAIPDGRAREGALPTGELQSHIENLDVHKFSPALTTSRARRPGEYDEYAPGEYDEYE